MTKSYCYFIITVISNEQCIINKPKKVWEETPLVAQGKLSKHVKHKVTSKLNKLFYILNSKCVIQLCFENFYSSNCTENAHINFSCLKKIKISKTELLYLYYQRQKTGSLSCFKYGSPDIQERNKLIAKAQRKQRTIEREKRYFQKNHRYLQNEILEESSIDEDSSVGSCCE